MRMTISSPRLRALTIAVGTAALALGSLVIATASSAETPDGTGDSAQARVVTPDVLDELEELEKAREEERDADGGFDTLSNHGCAQGRGCLWFYQHRRGEKQFVWKWMDGPVWYWYTGYTFRSAMNNFGNRRMRVRRVTNNSTRCLNPGQIRPTLPIMSQFSVGLPGTRC